MFHELLIISIRDATLLANRVHASCKVCFVELLYMCPCITGELVLHVTYLAGESGCHVPHHNVHL